MAMLSIVPTPIGNLQDVTIRAIRTLLASDYILTEEVVRTKNFIDHLKENYRDLVEVIKDPKIIQFNEFQENTYLEKFTGLLSHDANISLTSSAGTPLFSDPGFRLIQYALEHNINIESLPGPTAAIPALTLSGMPQDQVLFLGFLPKKVTKKENILSALKEKRDKIFHPTVIIYESPHRIVETLGGILKVFGNIQISICRELTKIHEEHILLTVQEALEKYTAAQPKGEFVLTFSLT